MCILFQLLKKGWEILYKLLDFYFLLKSPKTWKPWPTLPGFFYVGIALSSHQSPHRGPGSRLRYGLALPKAFELVASGHAFVPNPLPA